MREREDLVGDLELDTTYELKAIFQVDAIGSFMAITRDDYGHYRVSQAPQTSEDSDMENKPHAEELAVVGTMGNNPQPFDSYDEAYGFIKGLEFQAKMGG